MITINSGKVTVPESERCICHVGDNLHSTIQFVFENEVHENCTHELYLAFDNDATNFFVLDSEVANGSTILNWTISEEHIFKSGYVRAQIKTIFDDGRIIHTQEFGLQILGSLEYTGEFENKIAEFLQLEKRLIELKSEIDSTVIGSYVPVERTVAGCSMASDITSEQLQTSLKTYPIKVLTSAPTKQTKAKSMQMGAVISYNTASALYSVDLYLCCNADTNNSVYHWSKVTGESITDQKLSDAVKAYFEENPVDVEGNNGKSAYEIAVDNGYEGTESEWLLSLHGKDGEDGEDGVDGKDGKDGVSPVVTARTTSTGVILSVINDSNSSSQVVTILNGKDGQDGTDGYSPIKGVDYFTAEDREQMNAQSVEFISTELAKRGQLRPEFVNTIEECTDISKLYVLPDGYIYGYMLTEIVTGGYENKAEPLPNNTTDTSTWVNGYRFSSGGISAQSGTTLSNLISCTNGDIIRIKGVTLREGTDRIQTTAETLGADAVSYFNTGLSSGNETIVEYNGLADGVYTFTVNTGITHAITGFRFAMPTPTDASQVIITVNEEIVEPTVTTDYAFSNTGHAFVPADYEDRIIETESAVSRHGNEIRSLQSAVQQISDTNTNEDSIPAYWEEYLLQKADTINSLHSQFGKDCFSFIFMADIHYPSNLAKLSPLLAKRLSDDCDIKYVICAGDMQTRGCHSTKEALLEENELITQMFSPIRDRLLLTEGNHDGAYGLYDRDGDGAFLNTDSNGNVKEPSQRESYVYNLTPQQLHKHIYRKVTTVGEVHFDSSGTAYYIDDVSNNVRYIGLNTQCNDYELQADTTAKYPKMWIMRFSQAQLDFMINEALSKNLNENTSVVVFGHVPLLQEICDAQLMSGVLNAYKNRTTFTGSFDGVDGYGSAFVDADFTDAKGRLTGYFCGHNHVDSYSGEIGFPVITTRCDAKEENNSVLKEQRVKGTVSEQSFDVFTVNKATGVIYATKIGAGEDRIINANA